MPSLGGLKRRITNLRPHVQSAFIVFVTPRESPVTSVEDEFEVREITSAHDPLLDDVCPQWQRPWAEQGLKEGWLDIVVALKDGKSIGRIWEVTAHDVEDRYCGVPRVKLADDEFFMFDLFVTREYRRSNIGMTMADYFFRKYDPTKPNCPKYGYGFISYENAPSIMWHYSIGFNIVQTINYLSIGDRIKWRIPFSDVPRFGPLSKKGRFNTPDIELFGTSLFPNFPS
jgi:hypothetical protein